MDLSLILCTWNNADRLRITLDAIAQCDVPEGLRWELVLVNNNCTDGTDAVAAEFAERLPLHLVHEPTPGLSHARNAGLAAATGDLVVFTDDDVRPYPKWLNTYWSAYQRHPEGHYFGGPLESEFEGEKPSDMLMELAPWSVCGLDWGESELVDVAHLGFVSANWSCPRRYVDSIGGFNTNFGVTAGTAVTVGEESDLMARLKHEGLKPVYLPGARLRHYVPISKTTVGHVGERYEAGGRYNVLSGDLDRRVRRRLWGFPIGHLKRLAKYYLVFTVKKYAGFEDVGAYLAFREIKGEVMESWAQIRGRH